jgi:hypothetical protein
MEIKVLDKISGIYLWVAFFVAFLAIFVGPVQALSAPVAPVAYAVFVALTAATVWIIGTVKTKEGSIRQRPSFLPGVLLLSGPLVLLLGTSITGHPTGERSGYFLLNTTALLLGALILLLGFAALSLRGLIDPQSASARFGSAVSDPAGTLFYRVYLSRNLVIVAAGAILLLRQQWSALSILLTVTAALPLFDMAVLSANGVTPPAFHPAAFLLIAIAAALSWRRAWTSGA